MDLGLRESEGELADIYVVNTCAVTQKADKESLEVVCQLNRGNPKAKIFVTGCSAQNNPQGLKSARGVACVLENDEKENLPAFVLGKDEKPPFSLGRPTITRFSKHTRAFLKIQDGCNNGCAYCIIPKLRGASRSRPLQIIVDEARKLVEHGYKEIVLCGICLGAYGKDLGIVEGLTSVIEELEKIDGLSRIRLSSLEASDISLELINKMAASQKLCRHLHIPFQSGDDKILTLMNRKVTSADYSELVVKLRRLSPDIGITADIMVGFPGEEEINFNNTVRFLKEVKPSRIHVFSFSPRKGTAAFTFSNKVKPQIIKLRVRQIRALAKELSFAFCQANLGKKLNVLVESAACPKTGFLKGYSGNYIKVYIAKTQPLVNKIVMAKPVEIFQDGLLADLPPLETIEQPLKRKRSLGGVNRIKKKALSLTPPFLTQKAAEKNKRAELT